MRAGRRGGGGIAPRVRHASLDARGLAGKLKLTMERTINAKQLRGALPSIVRRVQRGERFVVLYRSRPAFRVVPVVAEDSLRATPLAQDPIYGAGAVGRSTDGFTSKDHDRLLYGPRHR